MMMKPAAKMTSYQHPSSIDKDDATVVPVVTTILLLPTTTTMSSRLSKRMMALAAGVMLLGVLAGGAVWRQDESSSYMTNAEGLVIATEATPDYFCICRGASEVCCSSDFESEIPCCGQPGGRVPTRFQCPQSRPICDEYIYNNRYGHCVRDTDNVGGCGPHPGRVCKERCEYHYDLTNPNRQVSCNTPALYANKARQRPNKTVLNNDNPPLTHNGKRARTLSTIVFAQPSETS